MSANQTTASVVTGRTSTKAKANADVTPSSQKSGPHAAHTGLAPVRRSLARLSNYWLPRAVWSIQRTGRLGLTGLALLVASLIFLISTNLPLVREVEGLRTQLASAHRQVLESPAPAADHGTVLLHSLPARGQMPGLLRTLLQQAGAAHLSIDTGKYEITSQKTGGVLSYQISFPVTGPYPQVRQFIDATLVTLPAAAMSELSLTRKTINDGAVEAQIRLIVFTQDSQ